MSTIQFKRGSTNKVNAYQGAPGEPVFDLATKKLYVSDGSQKTLINPDISVSKELTSGTKIATISVGDKAYEILAPTQYQTSINTILASGVHIATLIINGTAHKIYAPSGGDGQGSLVTVSPMYNSGIQLANIDVDGVTSVLYMPAVEVSAALTTGHYLGSVSFGGQETKFYSPAYEGANGITVSSGIVKLVDTAVIAGSYEASIGPNGLSVPSFTVNSQGRLTNASTTTVELPEGVSYTAGRGLTLSGGEFSISNTEVVADQYGSTAASATLANGGGFTVPHFKVNPQGQLTAAGTTSYKLPAYSAGGGLVLDNQRNTFGIAPTNTSGTYSATLEGTRLTVPSFTIDSYGRVTSASSTTHAISTGGTAYTAGTGLSLSADNKFSISNTGVGTSQYGNASTSAFNVENGGNIIVPYFRPNAQGQLTSAGTATYKLPTYSANKGLVFDEQTNTVGMATTNAAGTHSASYTSNTLKVPSITVDSYGRVTSAGTTSHMISTGATYTAGTGLTLSGNQFSVANTNVGTSQYGSASTLPLDVSNGGSIVVPYFKPNAQGQLTSAGETTYKLPTYSANKGLVFDSTNNTVGMATTSASGTHSATYTSNTLTIPSFTIDSYGRVTGKSTTSHVISAGTAYTAGTGLALSADNKFSISDTGVGTSQYGSASTTAINVANGGNIIVPHFKPNAQGQLISAGTATYKLPTYSADKGLNISANVIGMNVTASSAVGTHSATYTNNVLTVPSLTVDSYGRVTGKSVTSHTISAGTTYTAGRGITISGGAIGLDMTRTASTYSASSSGNTLNIPYVTVDSCGRVTSGGTTSHTISTGTTYAAGSGLTLTGSTFSVTSTAVTSGTYGPTAATSALANGGSMTVPRYTVNKLGQITSGGTTTYTLPTYSAGTGLALSGTTFSVSSSAVSVTNTLSTGTTLGVIKVAGATVGTIKAPATSESSTMIPADNSTNISREGATGNIRQITWTAPGDGWVTVRGKVTVRITNKTNGMSANMALPLDYINTIHSKNAIADLAEPYKTAAKTGACCTLPVRKGHECIIYWSKVSEEFVGNSGDPFLVLFTPCY